MNGKSAQFLDVEKGEGGDHLRLKGDWTIYNAPAIKRVLNRQKSRPQTVDAQGIEKLDTAGAWLINSYFGKGSPIGEVSQQQSAMLDFMPDLQEQKRQPFSLIDPVINFFALIGKAVCGAFVFLYQYMSFIGQSFTRLVTNLIDPRRFRPTSITRHIYDTGIKALPIIALLAFGTSMVVAYQGATQLKKFGADLLTIDLTVVSLLREMSVLITAIMVAGRSGSAFAAELGVMKLRGEVDALRVMGMNPIELLVLPRFLALLLTLPLLTFVADIVGLAGGWVMAYDQLDIGVVQYINRVETVITPTMFLIGMIKAPVFAFLIALICTYQGMNVSGSAENVGKVTTLAVVQSIFTIIMADALFSILFNKAGL